MEREVQASEGGVEYRESATVVEESYALHTPGSRLPAGVRDSLGGGGDRRARVCGLELGALM